MENTNIAELVERVVTGDPWHGSNVEQLLRGVSAEDAARRVVPGAHTMWELVLHMTGWAREVCARLEGRPAQEPSGGDWPAMGPISEERWAEAKRNLLQAHNELTQAVVAMDARSLDEPVQDFRDNPLGVGLSRYLTLHGLVHHTVYHAGQLGLLRKALDVNKA
jgi:uncharacterized damage-inducible protein DinB